MNIQTLQNRPQHRPSQNKHPTHAYRGRHTQQPHHTHPSPIHSFVQLRCILFRLLGTININAGLNRHSSAPNFIQSIHHQQYQYKEQCILGIIMRLGKYPRPQCNHQNRHYRAPSQLRFLGTIQQTKIYRGTQPHRLYHPPTVIPQSQQIQSPQPKDKKSPQQSPTQQQLHPHRLGKNHLLGQITHTLPNRTEKLMLLYLIKPHPPAQKSVVLHPNRALGNLIQMHPIIVEREKPPNRIKQKEPDPWPSSFQNAIFPALDHAVNIIQINSMLQPQRMPQQEYKRKSNCDRPPCCLHEKP